MACIFTGPQTSIMLSSGHVSPRSPTSPRKLPPLDGTMWTYKPQQQGGVVLSASPESPRPPPPPPNAPLAKGMHGTIGKEPPRDASFTKGFHNIMFATNDLSKESRMKELEPKAAAHREQALKARQAHAAAMAAKREAAAERQRLKVERREQAAERKRIATEKEAASIVIQRIWRGGVCKRLYKARRTQERMHRAAIRIQTRLKEGPLMCAPLQNAIYFILFGRGLIPLTLTMHPLFPFSGRGVCAITTSARLTPP